MYTLNYKTHFDAAHHLENYIGKCSSTHGHTWEIEIEIKTKRLKNNMVIDFNDLEKIIEELDHKDLNQIIDFNPTCENLSSYLFHKIENVVPNEAEIKVIIWESPTASITYEE